MNLNAYLQLPLLHTLLKFYLNFRCLLGFHECVLEAAVATTAVGLGLLIDLAAAIEAAVPAYSLIDFHNS